MYPLDGGGSRLVSRLAPSTAARRALVLDLHRTGRRKGWLNKLGGFWVHAAETQAAALVNWVRPDDGRATVVGTTTFTADRGIAGNGTTGAVSLGVVPTTVSEYRADSCSCGIWSRTTGQGGNNSDMGCGASTAFIIVRCRNGSDQFAFRLNDGTLSTIAGVTDGSGLFAVNRLASATKTAWRNGAQIGADVSVAVGATATGTLYSGAQSGGGGTFGVREIALSFIGGGLQSGDIADMYTDCLAYMTAVGAA